MAISNLSDEFDGSSFLIWADGTNGIGVPPANDIMAHITRNFTSFQLNAVKKVATPDDIPSLCPQNFNLFSECFAAIAFDYLPTSQNDTSSIEYTIRADGGLSHIDVIRHTSDFEKKILPLQWAVDQVSPMRPRSCWESRLTLLGYRRSLSSGPGFSCRPRSSGHSRNKQIKTKVSTSDLVSSVRVNEV